MRGERSLCFAVSWRLQCECKSDACVRLCCDGVSVCLMLTLNSQAKCIKTGLGTHTCQCLSGWREDGDECQPINNCLDPSRGGCHPNATCIYVGPGQVRETKSHAFVCLLILSFIYLSIHISIHPFLQSSSILCWTITISYIHL